MDSIDIDDLIRFIKAELHLTTNLIGSGKEKIRNLIYKESMEVLGIDFSSLEKEKGIIDNDYFMSRGGMLARILLILEKIDNANLFEVYVKNILKEDEEIKVKRFNISNLVESIKKDERFTCMDDLKNKTFN